MSGEHYRLPLLFSKLAQKKKLEQCDLKNSIIQNIHLILTSRFGESKVDGTYGCSIWDYDFENIFRTNLWKEQLSKSIKDTLLKHELRLSNMEVKTEIGQEELSSKTGTSKKRIKKKVEIKITGNITLTNEPFQFYEKVFVSPFSFD